MEEVTQEIRDRYIRVWSICWALEFTVAFFYKGPDRLEIQEVKKELAILKEEREKLRPLFPEPEKKPKRKRIKKQK